MPIGVFDDGVVPMYSLEGAYLIDVLAPERVQVLVDSPECASRWGGGQLAAWFSVGHGTIFDSANHFEEQGFTRATHLREPEERQAFAIDHLGMTYAELRAVMEERWWDNATEVGKRVRDLSVFRLVSNFVREKRLAGD